MSTQTSIRFFHAAPTIPFVNIYVNGALLNECLSHTKVSEYIPLTEGQYRIDAYQTDDTDKLLYSAVIPIIDGHSYTIAITKNRSELQFVPTIDDMEVPRGETKFRVMNLSHHLGTIDVAVTGGDVLFHSISMNEISTYMAIVPMKVNLEVRPTGTRNVLLSIVRAAFTADQSYTIYLLDSAEGHSLAEVLLIPHI
ncbi:DUF4397 domain-containing protein [Priestia taiwanensis]|uniref:DUF4397 domain-containing protein n=1 Tax=Priestia taiwanensis TaxID=1347902 RepID=A0A917AKX8_9BACI|nr:DUF4397 domain-containing protein [Priestia taiwanensis]MBM7362132.1 hypothetical protein [Priestia taiwanensis]GGE59715.1 hypothetical protein GCM10007140_07550 [Priestia taiwanensis]